MRQRRQTVRRTVILACIATLVVGASSLAPTAAAPRCYPTNRFVVVTGGMVRDTLTRLMWQQDGSSKRSTSCGGADDLTCTRDEAKAYCTSLTLGGFSDWRLPTMKELCSIVDLRVGGLAQPLIDLTAFPNTPGEAYWTSTPRGSATSEYGWYVDFYSGSAISNQVQVYNRVRCVR